MSDEALELLRRISIKLDTLTAPREALRRREAARAMGVSLSKLEKLIKRGKVRTSDDAHLVPMSEVRRYCAPKTKRARKPSVGHRVRNRHVDGQSDEAVAELRQRLRAKAAR